MNTGTIEVMKLGNEGLALTLGPVTILLDIATAQWLIDQLINNLPVPVSEA